MPEELIIWVVIAFFVLWSCGLSVFGSYTDFPSGTNNKSPSCSSNPPPPPPPPPPKK